jgi:hypothetical protein
LTGISNDEVFLALHLEVLMLLTKIEINSTKKPTIFGLTYLGGGDNRK